MGFGRLIRGTPPRLQEDSLSVVLGAVDLLAVMPLHEVQRPQVKCQARFDVWQAFCFSWFITVKQLRSISG